MLDKGPQWGGSDRWQPFSDRYRDVGFSSMLAYDRLNSAKSGLSSDLNYFETNNYFMWPFKKHLPVTSLNSDATEWSVFEASTVSGPMLVRVNTTAKQWAKHPELGIRVGFAIPLNHPNPGALPDPSENLALNQVEDKILACLKSSGPTIHALSITTGTFKEFVFYIQNSDIISGAHARLKAEISSHDVQCVAEHDAKWTVYSSFSQ